MALSVEVAGYGICMAPRPYGLMVICVQQESFQAWTVYRRYAAFLSLFEQLRQLYPVISGVPPFNPENLSFSNLEDCRASLDQWLKSIASNSMILRTQSMYQFLCVEANQPPQNLEIHWRESANGSFDEEMEMEDMFDDGYVDGDDIFEDDMLHHTLSVDRSDRNSGGSSLVASRELKLKVGRKNTRPLSSNSNSHTPVTQADEHDDLNVQSLSVGQAEFLYDRMEEERLAAAGSRPPPGPMSPAGDVVNSSISCGGGTGVPKRTINLDSFQIIKVIGKGRLPFSPLMIVSRE
jgi:hypothetical protein